MKRLMISTALLGLTLTLAACGSSGLPAPTPNPAPNPNPNPNPNPSPVQPVIKPETRVPDAASRAALREFRKLSGDGRARYQLRYDAATDFIKNIKPGDVLVSEPGPNAPYGYLVKVTAVQRDGGQVVVQAQQGRLTDAIARGRIDLKQSLDPSRLVKTDLASGVRMATRTAEPSDRRVQALSDDPLVDWQKNYHYEVSLNKVLYDLDGNESTKGDQGGSEGKFHFNMNLDFFLNIDWLDLDFRAKVDVDQGTELKLYARAKYELKKEFKLSEMYFTPITVPIGPVTVVIVPVVTLYLDASGSIQGEVSYELQQTFKATAGVEYIDEFKNLSSGPDYTFKHSGVKATASAEAQVGPRLRAAFLLYGVAGLYGEAKAYANFKAQMPAKPLWKLDLCAAANVGVEADLFFDEFHYGAEVFKKCAKIAQAENTAPKITEITAVRDNVVFGGNVGPDFTTTDDVKICAKAKDDENDPITLRFTGPGNLDKNGGNDGCVVHNFKTAGNHVVTVTARDPEGASSSKPTTVKVVKATAPAPVVTITSPAANDVLYLDPTSVTKALVGKSDLGDCAKEKWTSSNPADLMPTNNCASPTATFTTTGPRTLTLTATNADGVSGKASVTITVNPKPVENKAPTTSLSLSPNGNIVNNELLTATYTLDDPNNDPVSYQLRLFSKTEPNKVRVLEQTQATNTLGGAKRTKTFRMGDDNTFGPCPKGKFVLELTATDGKLNAPTRRVEFDVTCFR